MKNLEEQDREIFQAIAAEKKRQEDHLELIASENYVSKAVLEAQGSILTNKYAEGYPGKRYYGGCQYVDEVENLAKERLKRLFDVDYVNVQPHSGSQANMAAYRALLDKGDRILGMALDHGGHLTHGYRLSFSGQDYVSSFYGVSEESETIDYDEVERIAVEVKPRLIVAGASAYPRTIDFRRFREIADKVGAYLMVDMAHIAGLVAAGLHPNPCEYADVVTSTTHKTLRGPRGGILLTKDAAIAEKIDKSVFPGCAGRTFDACDRRESGGVQGSAERRFRGLSEAGRPERKSVKRRIRRKRLSRHFRGNGQSSAPGRCAEFAGDQRSRLRTVTGYDPHYRQQEHDSQ